MREITVKREDDLRTVLVDGEPIKIGWSPVLLNNFTGYHQITIKAELLEALKNTLATTDLTKEETAEVLRLLLE